MRFCPASALALGLAVAFTDDALRAHHSFSGEFDNSIAVTLYGVVASVEMVNPHSFIYLDVTVHGRVERWALEGPAPRQVLRSGLPLTSIKAGAELGACGYLARSDVAATRREPATGKAARKLQAAVLTLAHRERLLWSNYRQRKCGLDN
jgi:hypothetical protein